MPVSIVRILLTTIILCALTLSGAEGAGKQTFKGTPDKHGSNAEVHSLSIFPRSVPPGTYPAIVGTIRNTSTLKNRNHGKAVFDVRVVVTYPDGLQKNYLWHNVSFAAAQTKSYACVNTYDIGQTGIYKVIYSVYKKDEKHLYAARSDFFTVGNPLGAARQVVSPQHITKAPRKSPRARKKSVTMSSSKSKVGGSRNRDEK